MNSSLIKKTTKIIALILITFITLSCKKGKQSGANQKEVTIEYRITPYKNVVTNGDIIYTDEAGVVTVSDKRTLPFSRKFKRTINKYAIISLGIIAEYAGSVKMEIIIDDKVVSALISSSVLNKREMIKYKITI